MRPDVINVLTQTNFKPIDWLIVIVYLIVSVFIGLSVKKYIRNMVDFIGANRSIGTALGVATLTGTEMGLITVMYSAQKGFTGGFASFHIALIAGVVTLFIGLTGFIVYPLRKMKVLTIPEFYGKRYGNDVRILGAIMLAVGGILNMGLFLKVGSIFIVGITGLSTTGWALPVVMTVLLLLVLIYTIFGGMVAVVITDYIQFLVLSIGILLSIFLSIQFLGWHNIFATISKTMGAKGFNPLISEGGFGPAYVMWMGFLGIISAAVWPTAVARALAAKSAISVKKQYTWASVSFLIRFLLPYFLGISAFVFIMTKAPHLKNIFFPDKGQAVLNNLYAMPIFLGRILPSGIIGLIAAGMIAAFMSTHDSYLLTWSSVITYDIVAPLSKNRLSTQTQILITRIVIFLIGLYILYWGLIYKGTDDIWDYMAVTGAIYSSGAFVLLFAGLYWKKASRMGAFMALISGFLALFGLSPIQKLFSIHMSSARVGLLTVLISLMSMMIGSLLFPDKKESSTKEVLS